MSRFKLKISNPEEENIANALGISDARFEELGDRLLEEMDRLSGEDNGEDQFDASEAVVIASTMAGNKEELFILGMLFGIIQAQRADDDDDLIEVDLNDRATVQALGGLLRDPRQYHD